MKKYLIIHGHFYQPPREDPFTGVVPLQPSAAPFDNWNLKITEECYKANTVSRYLDAKGRIRDLVNNYEYISNNFGPTLLDYLKLHAPTTYESVIQADRISARRLSGRGNALAQGYNHTILPLNTPRDAEIQILWAMGHFEAAFGRKPDGFWCPEAGISPFVADLLIKHNISYVILSPQQAGDWREEGEKAFHVYRDENEWTEEAYYIQGREGRLNVLFYHNPLSMGVSFNHYLQNADTFYCLLRNELASRKGNLLTLASDGEIYGHHEPFGDMGLAALIKKFGHDEDILLTNAGHYLSLFPPKKEVRLKGGEENKGTSWSCYHGVSRWYKDCGCTTGSQAGENQKWRTGLRKGFDRLNEKLVPLYREQMARLTGKDPDEVLAGYISVLTGVKTREGYFAEVCPGKREKENLTRFLTLLEGQKYAQFMYTSCAWFFNELTRLEPVQNIRYALKAALLYTPFADEDLVAVLAEGLETAVSNLPGKKTGKDILLEEKEKSATLLYNQAAYYIFRRIMNLEEDWDADAFLAMEEISLHKKRTQGTIRLLERPVRKIHVFSFSIRKAKGGREELTFETPDGPLVIKPSSLTMIMQKRISRLFNLVPDDADKTRVLSFGRKLIDTYRKLEFFRVLDTFGDLPRLLEGSLVNLLYSQITEQEEAGFFAEAAELLGKRGPLIDQERMEYYLKKEVARITEEMIDCGKCEKRMELLRALIPAGWEMGVNPLRGFIQVKIFTFLDEKELSTEEQDEIIRLFNLSLDAPKYLGA